jgi:hypothetical protein
MFVAWLFLWWWLEKKFNQLVGRTDLKSARPTPPRAA